MTSPDPADPAVIRRQAARALVLTPDDRLLLLRIREPDGPREFWLTPGGGIEAGEDPAAALRRELREEVGLEDATPGALVWRRHHAFTWDGRRYAQDEAFYVVRVARAFEASMAGNPAAAERLACRELRWWTLGEVQTSRETFAPRRLGPLLEALLRGGPPASPLDAGV